MKHLIILAIAARLLLLTGCTDGSEYQAETPNQEMTPMPTPPADYRRITFNTITGEPTSLADFNGKVVLLVNTASKCGFTKQYAGLEELYRDKKDEGFVVIGFPANQFGNQEPGTNEEILNFCRTTFDVTFPIMEKIVVRGEGIHPLYKYLTQDSHLPGEITWNFNKFLLDREGNLVARFDSNVAPDDLELLAKIDELL